MWAGDGLQADGEGRGSIRASFLVACDYEAMAKNLTVRLDDELAADTEALARAEGTSLNETVKQALIEAVERRRNDPEFKIRLRRIIEEDRELLERLAK
jgi:hypothetical protein